MFQTGETVKMARAVAGLTLQEAMSRSESTSIDVQSQLMPERVHDWRFPVTFDERLRCAVFEDLHSKRLRLSLMARLML